MPPEWIIEGRALHDAAMVPTDRGSGPPAPGTIALSPFKHHYTAALLYLVNQKGSVSEAEATEALSCSVEALREAAGHLTDINSIRRLRGSGGRVEYRKTKAGEELLDVVRTADEALGVETAPGAIGMESEARRRELTDILEAWSEVYHELRQ